MSNLYSEIESAVNEIGHGWTSVPKAQAMGSMIVALQPEVSVEIGVYAGKGFVSMALAHKFIKKGFVIGIDPYSSEASVEGQINEADKEFWSRTPHEAMWRICTAATIKYEVTAYAELVRKRSDEFNPIPPMSVLRIDGNHGEQAVKDTVRYAPKVLSGGFLILDDLDWCGKATNRAAHWILQQGCWKQLYRLDDGLVFQRT